MGDKKSYSREKRRTMSGLAQQSDQTNSIRGTGAEWHSTIDQDLGPMPCVSADIQGFWTRIGAAVKRALGEAIFRSWISHLTPLEYTGGTLILAAPSRFLRDWVNTHYLDVIIQLCQTADPRILRLQIRVIDPGSAGTAAGTDQSRRKNKTLYEDIGAGGSQEQIQDSRTTPYAASSGTAQKRQNSGPDWGSYLDPRLTFESFIIGAPNALAHAAAQRVAAQEQITYNPLFIHAPVGQGKTHLLHAAGWAIREHAPEKSVIYLTAETFMVEFVRALQEKRALAFKDALRKADAVLIDDMQFIVGKGATLEEFTHTFNALLDGHKQIIISADRPPSDLTGLGERLRSRLAGGLVADIQPADKNLRWSVIQAKIGQYAIQVDAEVQSFLAERVTGSLREVEGALNRLVAQSNLTSGRIDMACAENLLKDLIRAQHRRLTVDEIQRCVADYYNLRPEDMQSPRRSKHIARPRQTAMYLAKQLTTRSMPEIGRRFGGRDHTTIIHAVRRIESLIQTDPVLAEDVVNLRQRLDG